MKVDFIKRGAETRLILIYAGWSTGLDYYRGCVAPGWDTAVVYDYRDMELPAIPQQYTTIYVFAYSLGVWAASAAPVDAAVRVAVCGTPFPVSDEFGIPESIFKATADNLSDRSLQKFHRRMAGGNSRWLELKEKLPASHDIEILRDELRFIEHAGTQPAEDLKWHRAYIASDDAIIPTAGQLRFWKTQPGTSIVMLQGAHAVDMARVIKASLPDTGAICRSFSKARDRYSSSAVVQAEVSDVIAEKLRELHGRNVINTGTLLEIGAGQGMLTRRWAEIFTPASATFIDLCEMPEFGVALSEEYLMCDAERVLSETGRKFDIILSASTIQWFADPIGFLKDIRSHLNPGGIAVISSYARGNLGSLDDFRPSPI
ncbi:MAG: DUF452 family protein, partial [Muribaculaceae bacterium]|nr:DUF452 family protein [Muribaculaceae bacterium]